MQAILGFFETIPATYRTVILVSGLVGFWILEGAIPLFAFQYSKVRHAALNFFFTVTTLIVNFALAFLILYFSPIFKEGTERSKYYEKK